MTTTRLFLAAAISATTAALLGACGNDLPGGFGAGDPTASGKGTCTADAECGSGRLCELNQCINAHCVDGTLNGTETDVDCGGGGCLPCAEGNRCEGARD